MLWFLQYDELKTLFHQKRKRWWKSERLIACQLTESRDNVSLNGSGNACYIPRRFNMQIWIWYSNYWLTLYVNTPTVLKIQMHQAQFHRPINLVHCYELIRQVTKAIKAIPEVSKLGCERWKVSTNNAMTQFKTEYLFEDIKRQHWR